jgi:hypothetical protein
MKKLILSIAILVGLVVPAQAHEFEVSGKGISMKFYNFSGEKDILNMDNGTLTLNLQNDTDQEIIAWSGRFQCDNALGDAVINIKIKSENANLPAGESTQGQWGNSAFMSDSWEAIAKGKAKNYNCELNEIKVAQ